MRFYEIKFAPYILLFSKRHRLEFLSNKMYNFTNTLGNKMLYFLLLTQDLYNMYIFLI